jgi:hypothetical protein
VYSTCLFCHERLGSNECIEHFPVGRRLAFDAVRGRLWAICAHCRNWNLAPIEERWEAIEECERSFRETPLRVSTENIGLATMREGLDLVRVGRPLRPEFAAWRYGDRLRARRVRSTGKTALAAAVGSLTLAAGGLAVVGVAAVTEGLYGPPLYSRLSNALENFEYERVVARVRSKEGKLEQVRAKHLSRIEFIEAMAADGWLLRVAHDRGVVDLKGQQAMQTAGQLLALMNAHGGSAADVEDAAGMITSAGDAAEFMRKTIRLREERWRTGDTFLRDRYGALSLAGLERLALEMAVHEDAERLALQGELEALEAAWSQAEEIAAISDSLLVPDAIVQALARFRSKLTGGN